MREISLDRLRTLVAVADLGSFAQAATLLNLAPPTVSLHISELESRVGGKLLTRTRGNIQPSALGYTLVERSRRLLADAEQALDEVRRQVQGLTGRVRLGASTGALAQLLPQALEILSERHPAIDIQVSVLTSQETLRHLTEGQLEIGLVALPQPAIKNLHITPWRRDPVMAFLPARWNCPDSVTAEWLADQPLILNDKSTQLSRLLAEWFAAAQKLPTPRIELNYNDAIKSLVAAGYGATLLPHEASTPQPDPRTVMRPITPELWRQLGIAHRSSDLERGGRCVVGAEYGSETDINRQTMRLVARHRYIDFRRNICRARWLRNHRDAASGRS